MIVIVIFIVLSCYRWLVKVSVFNGWPMMIVLVDGDYADDTRKDNYNYHADDTRKDEERQLQTKI